MQAWRPNCCCSGTGQPERNKWDLWRQSCTVEFLCQNIATVTRGLEWLNWDLNPAFCHTVHTNSSAADGASSQLRTAPVGVSHWPTVRAITTPPAGGWALLLHDRHVNGCSWHVKGKGGWRQQTQLGRPWKSTQFDGRQNTTGVEMSSVGRVLHYGVVSVADPMRNVS